VDYYPIDFRIFAPRQDGKTKNDHFRDMLIGAVSNKRLRAKKVLFDSWYASVENLKLVVRLALVFVTTLKSNRLVSLSKEGGYVHLDQLEWNEQQLKHGMIVELKELPFKVLLFLLFKVALPEGGIEWVITNGDRPDDITTHSVQEENEVRWQVEQLHRELKQLTGIPAPKHASAARLVLNVLTSPIATTPGCLSRSLPKGHCQKVIAKRLGSGKTIYQVKADLFSDYLRAQLRNPIIPAYALA
jgi:hypothetical protein